MDIEDVKEKYEEEENELFNIEDKEETESELTTALADI